MVSSGTYAYNPAAADLFAAALSMVGVKRTEITPEHMVDAALHANMTMVDFSNRNPNQWMLETVPIALVSPNATYSLPNRTIAIGAAYVSISVGGNINDRLLTSMSATEYAAIPNKTQKGFPNSYWVNLFIPTPQITVYYVPDTNYNYTLNLTTFRQGQDIIPQNDQTIDAPYRFMDAFLHGLASRLAVVYPDPRRPGLANDLDAKYEKKLLIAASQDQEDVNLYVVPGLQGYFR
jgi:hypothetical protein